VGVQQDRRGRIIGRRQSSRPAAEQDPLDRQMLTHVGARVRRAREGRGLSAGDLAELADLTEAELRDIEQGATRGAPEALMSIAQVLRVELASFFQAADLPRAEHLSVTAAPAAGGIAGLPMGEAVLIVESFARISDPARRRKMLELVRAVADAESSQPAAPAPAPRH
jgi:transcriptional regulator with XRE-family HTH domain